MGRLVGVSVGRLVGLSVGRLVGLSVGQLVGRSVGRSDGWSVGRSVGRWVGGSVGWSALLARSVRRFSLSFSRDPHAGCVLATRVSPVTPMQAVCLRLGFLP